MTEMVLLKVLCSNCLQRFTPLVPCQWWQKIFLWIILLLQENWIFWGVQGVKLWRYMDYFLCAESLRDHYYEVSSSLGSIKIFPAARLCRGNCRQQKEIRGWEFSSQGKSQDLVASFACPLSFEKQPLCSFRKRQWM